MTVGSTSFFKAVEGVRERWTRTNSSPAPSIHNDDSNSKSSRASTPPIEVSKADFEDAPRTARPNDYVTPGRTSHLRPFSLTSTNSLPSESPTTSPIGAAVGALPSPLKPLSAWGSGFGSFLSAKTSRFSMALKSPNTARPGDAPPLPFPHTPQPMTPEQFGSPEGSPLFNGMSPGTSPTGETDAMVPTSIASVLSASMSEQTVVPSISVSGKEHLEKHEQQQQAADEGFRVL